ncbi:hypothetical protein [Paenibacillus montanisoli]|uniref:Uncharacterized protein n=1 Tax=Paenibacillus montanisoli TaxID=2081970 RepID=A0A328U8H8_9BACL|nr:hypothetical protein [Paenibacillus montanisoli]RAP76414.1 hypothetical protein DL346_13570 [Paenibacillus montanisoli]
MKWSGFLIGSLAGMAAAAYVAKRRPGMFAWASSAAGNAVNGMTRRAMGAVISRKFDREAVHHAAPKRSGASAKESGDAWGQIEVLLNSDPGVKEQVDQIKAEAKPH